MPVQNQQRRHPRMNNVQGDTSSVFIVDFSHVFPTKLIKFRRKQLRGSPLINVLYIQLMAVLLKMDLTTDTFKNWAKSAGKHPSRSLFLNKVAG